MSYRVEVWSWEERKSMERLEERYMRWVLGVDGVTRVYDKGGVTKGKDKK